MHREIGSGGWSSGSRRVFSAGGELGRRRRSARGLLLALLAIAAAVVAGGWWLWSLPVEAAISAAPSDAVIASCDTTATGTLRLAELPAGRYDVTVSRPGFEPLETTVDVTRFGANEFSFELDPLPQPISVVVTPDTAVCRIFAGTVEVAAGDGSVTATLPAAAYRIEVSSAGMNVYEREIFLDRTTSLAVRLDPEGQLVHAVGLLPCAGAPKGVVVTPDGQEAWATILNGPPSIEIFDLGSMERSGSIDLGEYGAVEIVFSADGRLAYASQMETAKVFEIDTATRRVLRELPTESAWTKVIALSPDGGTLFAANWSGDDVSEIDLASGTVRRRIPTADTPRGLWPTPDGATLYVAGYGGGELQRVDLASGRVETIFDSNGALRHLVGDPERGVLFVSDMARDVVFAHDIATGKTTTLVETDEKPNTIDLSPDGTTLFVSCRGENNPKSYYIPGPEWGTILLFDATTGAPLDAIVGGDQCTALDVSDDGGTLVFSDFLDDRLQVFEVPGFDVLSAGGGGRWDKHFADLKK